MKRWVALTTRPLPARSAGATASVPQLIDGQTPKDRPLEPRVLWAFQTG